MRKLCLVLIESSAFDYTRDFVRAFDELNINAEIVKLPFFKLEELTSNKLNEIKGEVKAKKQQGKFVLFFAGMPELFLKDSDWSFVCSHYSSWYDHTRTSVIPHVWTNIASPTPISSVVWTEKPALQIGFMGTAFLNSTVGRVVSNFPTPAKKWVLRGTYLRGIEWIAALNQVGLPLKHINTFARAEVLETLSAKNREVERGIIEVTDTKGFTGLESDKNRFIKHLQRATYIICPRGTENFSMRVYEALKYGRIPVIIDTDMVLPKEIDWEQVAIRVPYSSLEKTYEIILQDYTSKSAGQFFQRQKAALSTMSDLESMHWLTNRLKEVTAVM